MPLFGRTEPLAAAARALDEATAGRGNTLVVIGEPGIGKSALARALAAQAEARGARVGLGRAWEVGGAPAFWPWTQALAELGYDLDELLGSASGAMASAQRIVAFDRVVRAICPVDGPPVMLLLDDVHAADIASLELALAFARAAPRRRALLVVTTRESELHEHRDIGELVGKLAREGATIPLRRLDASDTASWLASVGFRGNAAEIHRLSEGNPLFIEEAMRLGVDRFSTAATAGVAVILAEHLARISASTRDLLVVASVLGREANLADVAALAGSTLDGVAAAAREGQLAGVLSPAIRGVETLVFAHVLLRDSLYGMLAPSRREPLHAQAAARVEAEGGPPALVVRHLLAAGDAVDAAQVVRAVCRAAEVEVARHASDSALEMIASVRTRLGNARLDEASTLRLDLAAVDATMRTAPSNQARALAADCAARAKRLGLATAQVQAALVYGHELLTGQVDPSMVHLLEDALVVTPAAERMLRARVLARLSAAMSPATNEARTALAKAYAYEALAVARELDHVPTLLFTLLWITSSLLFIVPLEERVALTTELVSLAREHGADITLAARGAFHAISLLESGRPIAARHEADAYYRLMTSLPIPTLRWRAVALRGAMAGLAGRLDEAREHADELHRITASGLPAGPAWTTFEIALAACSGDVSRLRTFDREIAAVLEQITIVTPWMACVDAMLGRSDAARARLRPVGELPSGLPAILAQSLVAMFIGSVELAEAYYEPLAKAAPFGRFFGGAAGMLPMGPVSRILGELALLRGDRDRARTHFETAIAESREMEAAPFLALSEAGLARCGAPVKAVRPSPPMRLTLTREGDMWAVTAGTSGPFRVKHAKGMEFLDHLVRSPGREVYVLVLAGAGEAPEDAGVILDEPAKQAYRRRVEELEDQLDEAERNGDPGRASRARDELEAVAEQLATAVGLGGRDRKAASNVERARVNVQRRIKDAIRRIGEHEPALGRYLDATVRTGTYCVYTPV